MAKKEKVLVWGNGAREHAFATQLNASESVQEVWCYPGTNAGLVALPKCRAVNAEVKNLLGVIDFARDNGVTLAIIGPEQPLADGAADLFHVASIPVLGPTAQAAKLESSKLFAKSVMANAGVPTAAYKTFTAPQLDDAFAYIRRTAGPWVIKADGLAAGKGVMVCHEPAEAIKTTRVWLAGKFGAASQTILIEEFLPPHPGLRRAEISVLGLVDCFGNVLFFSPAADYKRALDGDQGDNSGGMGAYAPTPWVTDDMMDTIQDTIFDPLLAWMKLRASPFSGILYAGLMWTPDGPKVVEFNVRAGDPEWPALAPLYEAEACVDLFRRVAQGGCIKNAVLRPKPGHTSVNVVLSSHGYPDPCAQALGTPIDFSRLPKDNDVTVFHAGTKRGDNGQVLVDGGRVLDVVATAKKPLDTVASIARVAAQEITWTDPAGHGPHRRNDIGFNVPISLD